MRRLRSAFVAIVVLTLTNPGAILPACAYETDQFSNRTIPINDSREVLNAKVNQAIAEVAEEWQGPRDEFKFVTGIWKKIGGRHWVDRIERFSMDSSQVEKLPTPPHDSIYSHHKIWQSRVAGMFGVGPTFKVNQVLIGSDKLGHFLSQGRKYYRRWLKSNDETLAANQSAFTERAIFGQLTTGSYSNADLVANFEGHRFYRSLFEDDVVADKFAILAWSKANQKWIVKREFDFADHVNEYWDEALNINHYDRLLYQAIRARLRQFCPEYFAAPYLFEINAANEKRLRFRYAHLQLRDTHELRLESICAKSASNDSDGAMHELRDP